MKIFIDTANLDQIKEINSWGIVDGTACDQDKILTCLKLMFWWEEEDIR